MTTPWRSRSYLDLSYADGKTCLRCGALGCEPCHYSGRYSDQLGKGGAQKSFDLTADLCRTCHRHFDLYEDGNDDARATAFMLLILKTLHRNLQLGLVDLSVRRGGLPEREGATNTPTLPPPSRRRSSATSRPSKVIPRGARIV